uniref:Farnesyl pyrophosphate synthetase putative n=1 Tax=Albugo laibachii Nc14 TaxID=890382 RepID=F0WUD3_9STRA|nr:farnesyl pyrophosphate synthetase putative [Albugo laibachii Nc14]|eukprot:CCA25012.1 farnesyl pyrophosphate synthetase putative [Albugo laibachii Nc14]
MSASEREEFIQLFHELKDDVLQILEQDLDMPQDAIEWIREVMEYNCLGGKLNRGLLVVECAKSLFGEELSPEIKRKANILGWCIELVQAFFLIADDIMDNSLMRRGQICWYKLPKVELTAVNDAFLMESFVFRILRLHFRNEITYTDIIHLFQDTIHRTEMGQLLDLTSQPLNAPSDLSRFTVERYRKIVRYKTAYYTFYLPLACAMLLRGILDEPSHQVAQDICMEIGEYFQIQDDFLDCFGDENVLGKVGTDIQDNKCSWLILQALDHANDEQRELLKEHYGSSEEDSVAKVKELYKSLNLVGLYHDFERETCTKINQRIAQTDLMPPQVFKLMVEKIFKRSK